jgi:hypothetical protein
VFTLRCFLCWAMIAIVPASLLGQNAQTPAEKTRPERADTPVAILHTQGGVLVNGYEATDSSALFTGDLMETKPGFSATLNLEGTTVQLQEETVAKLQDDVLGLDHGGVSVGTSKSFKVRVNCITVIPVLNEWTQYEVTDLNGTVQVNARKGDVRVEMGLSREKVPPPPQTSNNTTVHEGEQAKYRESEACGAATLPTGAGSSLSPKWIAVGAGGAGVLIWILIHGGGGKTPVSASQP